jgi:plastocyanin
MKKMKLLALGLGLCFVLFNTGCSKDTSSLADENGSVRTAGSTPTVYAGRVSITSGGFSPAELLIAANGTVLWTNNDNAVHTVTADNGFFDSGDLPAGATFTYTFSRGAYYYHCKYHPEATGLVRAMVK